MENPKTTLSKQEEICYAVFASRTLRDLRKKMGYTGGELARIARVNERDIRRAEAMDKKSTDRQVPSFPRQVTLIRILRALGVQIRDFWGMVEDQIKATKEGK